MNFFEFSDDWRWHRLMTWRMPHGSHIKPLDDVAFDYGRYSQTSMWHLFDLHMLMWRLIDDVVVKR